MTSERTDALESAMEREPRPLPALTDDQRAKLLPRLETLDIDELGEYKRDRKAEVDAIYVEIRAANVIQDRKIAEWHLNEATTQIHNAAVAAGRTDEQQAQLWLIQKRDDPGREVQARLFLGLPRIGRD